MNLSQQSSQGPVLGSLPLPFSSHLVKELTCSFTGFRFCIWNDLVLKVNKLTFLYQIRNYVFLLSFKLRKTKNQIKNSAEVKEQPKHLSNFFSFICLVLHLFWIFSSSLGILWEVWWYIQSWMVWWEGYVLRIVSLGDFVHCGNTIETLTQTSTAQPATHLCSASKVRCDVPSVVDRNTRLCVDLCCLHCLAGWWVFSLGRSGGWVGFQREHSVRGTFLERQYRQMSRSKPTPWISDHEEEYSLVML